MQWDDTGYLISKNKYNENSIIADFYTESHGKVSGIIFGATSKKIKNYLEIGNKLFIIYNCKSEGKLGYFKIEIAKVYAPLYFDNKKKLLCISSAMNLIKILTAELQENHKIFTLIDDFYINLEKKFWVKEYIFWELKLLKLVGYDLELKKICNVEFKNNDKKYYVNSNSIKKYVPNFLIDIDENPIDLKNLNKGLNLVSDYLEKNILKPNNISHPKTRLEFITLFRSIN